MSVMTTPLAAMGSGLDAVTEHLDPRPLVELVEKVDPRAVVHNLDPRRTAKPKRRRARGPLFLLGALALGGVAFWFLRNRRSPVPGAAESASGRDADTSAPDEWVAGSAVRRSASGL